MIPRILAANFSEPERSIPVREENSAFAHSGVIERIRVGNPG